MRQICVITGGGSGMGLATARIMGKTHYVIICGRTPHKLEKAITELKTENIECEAFSCDVSNQESVRALAEYSKKVGNVQSVIHAAGYAAIKRFGYAGEIAFLLASIVDSRNGYLIGVDIVCDRGLVASGVNPMHR